MRVTMEDLADYYQTQAGAALCAGIRTLGGITGDWRPIDLLAQECLEWFKTVNIAGLRRVAKRKRSASKCSHGRRL